jgi:threonine/homoserine/homoserine lactone efflux protein
MSWHTWLAFLVASAIMGLIPGPGVASIVGYALGSGRGTALASVAGMAVGNAVAITLSLAGVGALLGASALAFSVLKWAGALYLIGIGLLTLFKARSRPGALQAPARSVSPRAAFFGNLAVGTFHPKTIVFFVAFVPQFISPHASYPFQAALLVATFCATVLATDTAYALAASSASHLLRRPGVALWSKRASGGVLVAAGVATAAARG